MHQEHDASYPSRSSQPLINALTGEVGFSTNLSGFPRKNYSRFYRARLRSGSQTNMSVAAPIIGGFGR
jgi:hypothetical protein